MRDRSIVALYRDFNRLDNILKFLSKILYLLLSKIHIIIFRNICEIVRDILRHENRFSNCI